MRTEFDFAELEREMARQIDSGLRPSIQIAVDVGGELVFERALGDGATVDSTYVLWSSTKPLVAVALLQLVEEGRAARDVGLDLDRIHQAIGSGVGEGAVVACVGADPARVPDLLGIALDGHEPGQVRRVEVALVHLLEEHRLVARHERQRDPQAPEILLQLLPVGQAGHRLVGHEQLDREREQHSLLLREVWQQVVGDLAVGQGGEAVRARLHALIAQATVKPRKRKPTKPKAAAREKRLESKKRHGALRAKKSTRRYCRRSMRTSSSRQWTSIGRNSWLSRLLRACQKTSGL